MNFDTIDTEIISLGKAKIDSPMSKMEGDQITKSFVSDKERVLVSVCPDELKDRLKKGKEPVVHLVNSTEHLQ